MIRVAIADDHDVIRDGVSRILEDFEDLEVVGTAENGRATIELLKKVGVDVLLLDLDMPDMNGLEVTRLALSLFPELKIVILTMHDDDAYAERVMKAGASGYTLKASSSASLQDIIRKVMKGDIYVHPAIMEKTVKSHYRPAKKGSLKNLSDREYQILKYLAEGLTQEKIAMELNISASTVATHKRRLMKKLDFLKNVDLIKFAIDNKIIKSSRVNNQQ